MPIKKPSPHLMVTVGLKTAQKYVQKKAGRTLDVNLNLTPMIDMFVVLVIFLLITFSASGEMRFMQKEIELPKATQSQELEEAPIVTIGAGFVSVEDKKVGSMDDIAEDENFEIPDLAEVLVNMKRNFQQLHPQKKFAGKVIIQGDKEIPFNILKKVMFTCTSTGYTDINFAVLPSGSAAESAETD